jgi:Putative transposase of IS4/5 family (DUF4096)
MAAVIEFEDPEWALIEGLFDPTNRPGTKAKYPRRDIVDAILFIARTGIQWRYLPAKYPALAGGLAAMASLARPGRLGSGDEAARAGDQAQEEPPGRPDDGAD